MTTEALPSKCLGPECPKVLEFERLVSDLAEEGRDAISRTELFPGAFVIPDPNLLEPEAASRLSANIERIKSRVQTSLGDPLQVRQELIDLLENDPDALRAKAIALDNYDERETRAEQVIESFVLRNQIDCSGSIKARVAGILISICGKDAVQAQNSHPEVMETASIVKVSIKPSE